MATSSNKEETYEVGKYNELRFEVEAGNNVNMELLSGMAETFGSELVPNKPYQFSGGSKIAVYTFHGCKVKLSGRTEVAYVAKQTPMSTYVNMHAALEQMRVNASEKDQRGPRVLVVGPTDVGKSTLCRLLTNYAVRCDRKPILVDLDVGQGEVSIPGTIGGLIVQRPHDIEEGYPQSIPLVYHFGHKSPAENILLYNQLVSRLAQTINSRCEVNKTANVSGCIINSCGWIKGGGYKSLVHIAGAFEIDVIVVIDQERLFSELRRDMPEFVKVVQLPKSGGVVERSREARADTRDSRVRSYFYGIKTPLSPHCFYANFADIRLYKIGAPELPDSLLPLGMVLSEGKTKLMPMVPSLTLKHHVMSVSACDSNDEDIINTNVRGFIVITEVDMERMRFMILAPAPAPLPGGILLDTDITFMDIK